MTSRRSRSSLAVVSIISERGLERDADGGEWIQREREPDVYGWGSGHLREHTFDADAHGGGRSLHGDIGRCDGGGVQLHDPGNGRNVNACYRDRDADGGDRCDVDRHGQRYSDGVGGTERELHVFGGSAGGRVIQFGGEFWVLGLAGVEYMRIQSGVDCDGRWHDGGNADDQDYGTEFGEGSHTAHGLDDRGRTSLRGPVFHACVGSAGGDCWGGAKETRQAASLQKDSSHSSWTWNDDLDCLRWGLGRGRRWGWRRNATGDINSYGVGYGCGRDGARERGDADRAVGRAIVGNLLPRRRGRGKNLLPGPSADFHVCAFLRHIFLFLRHGDGASCEVGSLRWAAALFTAWTGDALRSTRVNGRGQECPRHTSLYEL
jgi:hypothetical protein